MPNAIISSQVISFDRIGSTSVDAGGIYEGGDLKKITIEEVINNPTAVKQLMNEVNKLERKISKYEFELGKKQGEIEYLKTSPFIAMVSALVSMLGGIISGIGVNMLTNSPPHPAAIYVIAIGGALILLSGIANIFYPYARGFFNKPSITQIESRRGD